MGAKFPGAKALPDSFGSLGLPETSPPASSKPTQNTSLFPTSSTSDEQLPPSTAPPSVKVPASIFPSLSEKVNQQSKDSAPTTQPTTLASLHVPLKPFTFPNLGELSSTATVAPPAVSIPTPLSFTLGQSSKSETGNTKSGAFNSLFSQPQQISSPPAAQPNLTSQPFGSSIFTQTSIPQSKPSLQSHEETLQPNSGAGRSSQPVYFDNLLENGKKRANALNGESGLGDLPSLQLGLGEIARKARELGGVVTQLNGVATVDGKASACELFFLISLREN